jgi:pyridoxal phosphate enzyme (YggS family)
MEALETLVQTRVAAIRARVAAAALRTGRDPSEVALMAAVKTRSAEEVAATVRAGVFFIGENRVQEGLAHLQAMDPSLRSRARIHFIGLLQANKARKALSSFDSLDSVDGKDLAQRLSRIAQEEALTKDVMIEVNLGEEAQKGGVPSDEVERLARFVQELPGLRLTGLMGVPPLDNEPEASRPFFRELARLFARVRETYPNPSAFTHLSMGMSHDFEVAVEEGATLVRVGTALYGARRST